MTRSDVLFKQVTKDKFTKWICNMEANMKKDPYCALFKVLETNQDGMPSMFYY